MNKNSSAPNSTSTSSSPPSTPSTSPETSIADTAFALVHQIRPILAGQPPEAQSVALAELLATWLRGFHLSNNPSQTKKLRTLLLKRHVDLVKGFLSCND